MEWLLLPVASLAVGMLMFFVRDRAAGKRWQRLAAGDAVTCRALLGGATGRLRRGRLHLTADTIVWSGGGRHISLAGARIWPSVTRRRGKHGPMTLSSGYAVATGRMHGWSCTKPTPPCSSNGSVTPARRQGSCRWQYPAGSRRRGRPGGAGRYCSSRSRPSGSSAGHTSSSADAPSPRRLSSRSVTAHVT